MSTSAETLIRELEKVFDTGENGLGQGAIKFQPISRMNAVLAVARSPQDDRQGHPVGAAARPLRHERHHGAGLSSQVIANAQRLVKVLNDIFVGRGGAGAGGDTAASQIAPGQNASQSRLDSLSAGSSFQNQGSSGERQQQHDDDQHELEQQRRWPEPPERRPVISTLSVATRRVPARTAAAGRAAGRCRAACSPMCGSRPTSPTTRW